MALYDCRDPDCMPCKIQFRRAAADPRDPDYSREGLFQTHNCPRCQSGKFACVEGNPLSCGWLHARND